MRKSFTRLFSIFLLLLGLSFQMAYGISTPTITFDGTKSIPTDENTNAKPADFATKFVVAFDAVPVISDAGGTVIIYKGAAHTLFKTIPVSKTSGNVVVVGQTVEITHGIASFTAGDIYQIAFTAGTINNLGNLSSDGYNFTVGDYVAPKLLTTAASFYPTLGATDVQATLDGGTLTLTIAFDEPVTVPANAGNKAVYIYKKDGTIVDIIKVGTVSPTIQGLQTATVNVPVAKTAIFQENTDYYVVIDAGAFVDYNVYDNKNAFAGLSNTATWVFKTRDDSAPAVAAKSITDIAGTTATLNVSLAEKGKYYYLVQLASATAPSAGTVTSTGTAVTVASANTNVPSALGTPTPLVNGKTYKVYIVTENAFGVQGTSVDNIAFTTTDNVAPVLNSKGILNNTDKKTYALYMVFNEQIVGGTGNLDLRLSSDQSYVKTISATAITSRPITSAEVTANTFANGTYTPTTSNYVAVVDLGMTLASKTNYYAVFPLGYIKDLAGNTCTTYFPETSSWPITSRDFELPTVSVAFADPSTLSSAINISFNETVQKQVASGTWKDVIALEQNNTALDFSVAPSGATNTNVITITPTTLPLLSNTTYTVRLRPDAVKDMSGNAITTEGVYTLTTGDLDGLTVAYGSSEGATVTSTLTANSTIKIDFNKAVKVNTSGSTWAAADATNLLPLMNFKKAGTDVQFTLAYDAASFTATLTPTAPLASNSQYVLTFNESKIKDVAGTTTLTATAATTTYTVTDYAAPVTTLSHSGNVTLDGTTATPTITFDGDVRLLNGSATIADGTDVSNLITFKDGSASGANLAITSATYTNKVITIVPATALASGKTYYYGIGASVKDAAGNITAGKFAAFTMVDPVNPPAITAVSYTINGSAQTPVGTKLINVTPISSKIDVTVTFNDNIKEVVSVPTYNTVSLFDGTTTWTADVTPTSVSGNTLTLSFATTATLTATADAGSVCTLTLPANIVRASTAYTTTPTTTFAQFAGKNILFDSKDITAPTVSANTPSANDVNVALNTALKLTLSEKVVLGSGDILIKEGTASGTTVQTIAVNSTNVALDATGTVATITKSNLIKYNTVYTVVVPAGAFKDDISGNSNTAANLSFTTVVNPQPTVSTYSPLDNSDQLATSGSLTLVMNFSENVVKYDPSVGSRKQWFLIKNTGTLNTGGDKNNPYDYSGTRAAFNGTYDLVAGTDVAVANGYIENSSVGITGASVSIATGFTPVAGERYYVLITYGAFLDASDGTASGTNYVPGVFAGITSASTWNFTTGDVNPGTVKFDYTLRADNLVAINSDIVITFSKPIKNGDGTAITDSQIANLFTLTKTADKNGPITPAQKVFIGTINSDKTIVTVLNSSLVSLGELTELSDYEIKSNGSVIYANGTAVSGATATFTTSDYTAGTVTPTVVAPVSDITASTATVTFSVSDNHNLAKVYYTIQEGDATTATPTVAVIKAGSNQTVTGTSATKTYKFTGLNEETSYVVWAVVVDAAGNESAINKVVFTTDDVTKPLISVLPTAFNADGTLTFKFNEAVNGANSSVRIIDAASMQQVDLLNLVGTNTTTLVTSVFGGLSTDNTTSNYYVEVIGGLVADVPVVAGDATNKFVGLYGTSLMVSSTDKTIPQLLSSDPVLPATNVDVNFSIKLNFNEAVKKATTIPANAFVVNKEITSGSGTYEPFEVVDPANVSISDKVATVTLSRTLASTTQYQLILNESAFTDLAGNAASGTVSSTITTKDVVAPAVVFSPANLATGVATSTTTLTMTFAEAIRLLDNSAIDSYDLDSLVYVKKGSTPVAFDAAMSGTNTITITLASGAIVKDATYTYGFKAKFEDGANNAIPAASATFSTVTSTPAAQYLTWTPAKNLTTYPLLGKASPVTLTFSGPIFTYNASDASKSNLPVTSAYLAGTVLSVTQTVGSTSTVTAASDLLFTVVDAQTVSVAPKAGTQWVSGATVSVTFNANTIQINEGNTTPVPGDNSVYKAEDTVAPTVVTYYPSVVGVTGSSPVIAKTDAITLTFNEDVKLGTATYEIYRWDGVLATSGTVTVGSSNKKLVTLGSLATLPTNVEYYAIVNAGAVTDLAGNPYAGLTTVKSWKFMLKDDAVPQIISYTPNTDNQSVDVDLTINFDRPVIVSGSWYVALYKSAAGGDAVQLWRGADNGSTGAFTVSGNTATVNLTTLEPNTKYFVELAAGTYASAADNSKTNVGIERSVWSFSTEVNDNPLATEYVPAKASTTVSLGSDLKVTFDQPVVAGTGNIQLMHKQASGGYITTLFNVADPTKVVFSGNTLTIPSAVLGLQENSEYYVIVPATAVKNTSYTPNYFAGVLVPFEWSFSTVTDATAPTLTVTDPVAPIAKVFTVGLNFSEPVTGVVSGTTATGCTSFAVTGSGSQYTITVTSEEQKTVTIVLANTITDLATPANAFAGKTLSYTTGDFTGPKLVSVTPNGTTLTTEKNHPVFVMNFDENVSFATAGSLNVYKKSDNSPALSIPITAAMISGKTATVTYTYDATAKNGLDKNTDYYVLVDGGIFKDANTNTSTAVTDKTYWTFKTGADFATEIVEPIDNSLAFKVYPNPFVDYVTVENASELTKLVVTNIAGQVVKEVVTPENKIQLNELRSGVYFMSLYQGNTVVSTVKIVKR